MQRLTPARTAAAALPSAAFAVAAALAACRPMRLATPTAVLAPPAAAPTADAPRPAHLYYDRAHGEGALPSRMRAITERLGLAVVTDSVPLTADGLRGARVLYLLGPKTAFAGPEQAAVVAFVRGGGSLLLVMDEESRQSLAGTGVNDLVAPFGLRLTPDTRYVPNPGALAPPGEITRAARELPYDGGRAVEGGTPFAFQLDSAGRPAQPFAAYAAVATGGRVVVMGEAMASIFLGSAGGTRLAPAGATTPPPGGWWGKDSAVFMEEVLAWLARR